MLITWCADDLTSVLLRSTGLKEAQMDANRRRASVAAGPVLGAKGWQGVVKSQHLRKTKGGDTERQLLKMSLSPSVKNGVGLCHRVCSFRSGSGTRQKLQVTSVVFEGKVRTIPSPWIVSKAGRVQRKPVEGCWLAFHLGNLWRLVMERIFCESCSTLVCISEKADPDSSVVFLFFIFRYRKVGILLC